MSFWKTVQDKVILSRLEEEALHAAALEHFESGERRKGLWAKALIESEGDLPKAEAAYLRLLVSAMKDELYISGRLQDAISQEQFSRVIEAAAPKPSQVPVTANPEVTQAARWALDYQIDYRVCEVLIRHAGGSVEAKGFIFGMHYLVVLGSATYRLSNFSDLSEWVRANLPLSEWASGHS